MFVLITAMQTGDIVYGAMECQPDAYLIKPLSFQGLKERLQRLFSTKQALRPVLAAIDAEQYQLAINLCTQLTKSYPKLTLSLLKRKAQLHLTLSNFEQAEQLFTEILKIRDVPWAWFNLAQVFVQTNRHAQALPILETLLKKSATHTACYDLLAQVREALGQPRAAQQAIESALKLSPFVLKRQTELSRLAMANNDLSQALAASRMGIRCGRFSCFKNADNYIRLAAALQSGLNSDNLRIRKDAADEVIQAMLDLQQDFPERGELVICANLITSSAYRRIQKPNESALYSRTALDVMQASEKNLAHQELQQLSDYLAITCDPITIEQFVSAQPDHHPFGLAKSLINAKIESLRAQAEQAQIDEYNNKGVELFEQGALEQAISSFEKATVHAAVNFSILLNALQAHISLLEQRGTEPSSMQAINQLFARLEPMATDDRRQGRRRRLLNLYRRLEASSQLGQ